jgi:uncharacterized protein (DUF58 family)
VHAVGPVVGSIFTLLAWAAIAHNSGSGWVQALGAVLGAVLFVGILAPGRVVARANLEILSSPPDAVAGEPVELRMTSSTRLRVRPVEPGGKTGFVGPSRRTVESSSGPEPAFLGSGTAGADGTAVVVVPKRRGILVAVTVEIASAAPFGIVWWARQQTLALPAETSVAPKPTTSLWFPPENDDRSGESSGRRGASFGETRGVRDYEHGDARRAVHWRASAHTGRLMVREMETPTAEPVTLRLELPSDPVKADELAARALATVLVLIGRSRPVMLATHEPTGDRLALVVGSRDAGRRLARAVPRGWSEGSLTIDEPHADSGPESNDRSR